MLSLKETMIGKRLNVWIYVYDVWVRRTCERKKCLEGEEEGDEEEVIKKE